MPSDIILIYKTGERFETLDNINLSAIDSVIICKINESTINKLILILNTSINIRHISIDNCYGHYYDSEFFYQSMEKLIKEFNQHHFLKYFKISNIINNVDYIFELLAKYNMLDRIERITIQNVQMTHKIFKILYNMIIHNDKNILKDLSIINRFQDYFIKNIKYLEKLLLHSNCNLTNLIILIPNINYASLINTLKNNNTIEYICMFDVFENSELIIDMFKYNYTINCIFNGSYGTIPMFDEYYNRNSSNKLIKNNTLQNRCKKIMEKID